MIHPLLANVILGMRTIGWWWMPIKTGSTIAITLLYQPSTTNYPYEEPTTLKSEYFTERAYVRFDLILPLFALLFLSLKDGPPRF